MLFWITHRCKKTFHLGKNIATRKCDRWSVGAGNRNSEQEVKMEGVRSASIMQLRDKHPGKTRPGVVSPWNYPSVALFSSFHLSLSFSVSLFFTPVSSSGPLSPIPSRLSILLQALWLSSFLYLATLFTKFYQYSFIHFVFQSFFAIHSFPFRKIVHG